MCKYSYVKCKVQRWQEESNQLHLESAKASHKGLVHQAETVGNGTTAWKLWKGQQG